MLYPSTRNCRQVLSRICHDLLSEMSACRLPAVRTAPNQRGALRMVYRAGAETASVLNYRLGNRCPEVRSLIDVILGR
jgi:hypothetical protein